MAITISVSIDPRNWPPLDGAFPDPEEACRIASNHLEELADFASVVYGRHVIERLLVPSSRTKNGLPAQRVDIVVHDVPLAWAKSRLVAATLYLVSNEMLARVFPRDRELPHYIPHFKREGASP